MKTKIQKIQENLLLTIGKMITTALLKTALDRQIKSFEDDPKIKSILKSIKSDTEEYEARLKAYCKKDPNNVRCKELKGSDG